MYIWDEGIVELYSATDSNYIFRRIINMCCNETSELNRQNQIILAADNGHHTIIKYFDILSHR